MILHIGNRTTLVNNTIRYKSKSKDEKSSMHNRISLKSVPSYYLGHASGTKNKWVQDIENNFYVIRVLINSIFRRVGIY